MEQLVMVALASWLTGIVALVGGFIAHLESTAETEGKRELIHETLAFGGDTKTEDVVVTKIVYVTSHFCKIFNTYLRS